ncbi:hypothetical protein Tco_0557138 [Tanacetum coccineum]
MASILPSWDSHTVRRRHVSLVVALRYLTAMRNNGDFMFDKDYQKESSPDSDLMNVRSVKEAGINLQTLPIVPTGSLKG